MFCKNCGSPLNPNAAFCPNCGTPVSAPAQPQTPPAAPYYAPVPTAPPVRPAPPARPVAPAKSAAPLAVNSAISKGMIVKLALIAMILACAMTLFELISDFAYGAPFFSFRGIIGFLLELIPAALAVLFFLFCSWLDKKSPVLTGIPMIGTVGYFFLSIIIALAFNSFLAYDFGGVLNILVTIAFVVFFMLTITGKFNYATGKLLVILLGSVKCLLAFILWLVGLVQVFGFGYYPGFFKFLHLSGALCELGAVVLTTLAMIMIILRYPNQRANTVSAPAYRPVQPPYQPQAPVYPQPQQYQPAPEPVDQQPAADDPAPADQP